MKMLDKKLAYKKGVISVEKEYWFEFCEFKKQRLNLRHTAGTNGRFQE